MKKRTEDKLRKVFIQLQENNEPMYRHEISKDMLDTFLSHGFIEVSNRTITLTKQGKHKAEDLVRRYRLAERLLVDVLHMSKMNLATPSCQFEHKLPKEVEEAICTLLGHPSECPHGKPIPPGKCCKIEKERVNRLVYRLSELNKGDTGKIAYLKVNGNEVLRKLVNRGVHPGKHITILQQFPTIVFQIGETQLAVDTQVASNIFILKKES